MTIITMLATEYAQFNFPNPRSYFNQPATATVSCTFTCGSSATINSFTCNWDNSTQAMTATPDAQIDSCTSATLVMSTYINHDYTQKEDITARVYETGNTTAQTTVLVNVIYTEASIDTVTLTPNSLIVGATDTLTVNFNLSAFALTNDFKILMDFPVRFSFPSTGVTQAYLSGTLTCSNGTANVQAAPSCTFTEASGVATLSVIGIYSITIGTADSASFIIANIQNPISTVTVSGFNFTIVDPADDTFLIASKTTGITLKVDTAKSVSSLTVTPPSPYIVLNPGTVQFSITPGIEIESDCKMTLSIPTETS